MVAGVDGPRGWTLDNGLNHCRKSAIMEIVCLAALHMISAKCYRALGIGQLVSSGRRCSLMPSKVSFRVDVLEFEVVSSWGYHVAFSFSVAQPPLPHHQHQARCGRASRPSADPNGRAGAGKAFKFFLPSVCDALLP